MAISQVDFDKMKNQYLAKRMRDSEYRQMMLDVSNFVAPTRGRFLQTRDSTPGNPGPKRQYIYDDTATRAYGITAAGMKGGLCPHSLPWFKIGMYDQDMAEYAPVKSWLHDVQEKIKTILSKSNFYASATSVFQEQVLFGTAPISIDEDDDTHIVCRNWSAGEYTLVSDANGRTRAAFRELFMSPATVRDLWGEKALSESMKSQMEEDPYLMVKIIHGQYDRFSRKNNALGSKNYPVGSIFWDDQTAGIDGILHEGGFNEWPTMFPRWDQVAEDDYGSDSPAMTVLNDVKSLQELRKDILTLSKKAGFPALIAPVHLKGRLKNFPNAINYVTDMNSQIRPIESHQANIGPIYEVARELQTRIEKGFFNDLFLMILNEKKMTATEVAQRHEDKLTILGSVIERQNSEFLSPAIERVFAIGMRKQLFPKPPEEIQGADIKIDFISMLAQAQKMVGTQSIERSMGFVSAAAQLDPTALDVFDFDKAVRRYSDMQGADPDLVRPESEVIKIRKQRAAQQQAQMQADQEQQAAQTAQMASQSELGKNTMLDKMVGA